MGGGYVPNSGRPPGGQFPSYSFSSLVPVRHWARDPALRSWPVLLLVALVCVPPIALVLLNNPTEAKLPPAVPPEEAWWQHPPAVGAGPVPQAAEPAHASPAPADITAPHSATTPPTVTQPSTARRKPWWEQ